MRILITGGAGFLGSHLTERLIREGHYVIIMDNLITGKTGNITHLDHSKFKFINYNVTDYLFVDGKVDFILHFASPASPIDYLQHPIHTLKVGSIGTHKTLGLALEKSAKYLLASTSEVYGDPLENPQQEKYWGNVNTIGPRGVYDEAKRFSEALTMAYHRTHGLDTRIIRIFNTYGPRMRLNDGRVVPAFIWQALRKEPLTVFGDGRQTRSFCYVDDLIEGIHRLMLTDYHEPVNLGNPTELTVMDFARAVLKEIGYELKIENHPLPVDDPKVRRPDITLAKKLLGWEPQIDLAEGLRRTIDWMRQEMNLTPPI